MTGANVCPVPGELMHFTQRKTGFIGLLCNIASVCHLFQILVTGDSPPLRYLLTCKLSQDHLELFFAAIRLTGGWNNNPTWWTVCQRVQAPPGATSDRDYRAGQLSGS